METGAKGFTCWEQFVAMLFCQLAKAHSFIINTFAKWAEEEIYFVTRQKHHSVGTSPNEVMIQGWTAVIAILDAEQLSSKGL